ncbi:STAS domain-containing protein [Streptomyces sp. NPDC046931]|uniref:STAS domain-containing protein n=1 Tax=Streptomyces sp. NPDC046931 TaxID=3154806 RepID=UPI00340D6F2A
MTDKSGTARPDGLTITSAPVDGVSVITVRGEIDHHTGGALSDALSLPEGAAASRMVVNLSGVTFMDSSGINILIAARNAADGAGGWLRLAGPTESVLRTLQLVGLDEIINCYPTLRDALNA